MHCLKIFYSFLMVIHQFNIISWSFFNKSINNQPLKSSFLLLLNKKISNKRMIILGKYFMDKQQRKYIVYYSSLIYFYYLSTCFLFKTIHSHLQDLNLLFVNLFKSVVYFHKSHVYRFYTMINFIFIVQNLKQYSV